MATKVVMAVVIIIIIIIINNYSITASSRSDLFFLRSLGYRSSLAFLSATQPTRKVKKFRRPRLMPIMTVTTDGKNDNTIVKSSTTQQTTEQETTDDVRAILDFLQRTYPPTNDNGIQIIHNKNNDLDEQSSETDDDRGWRSTPRQQRRRNNDWTKTRNYLYRYNANIRRRRLNDAAAAVSNAKSSNNNRENIIEKNYTNNNSSSDSNEEAVNVTKQKNKEYSRRQQQVRGPITIAKIQHIIHFLNYTFPNLPDLQARILQNSPRIIGQYHSIHSRLLPTVDFLQSLYGSMEQQSQHEGVKKGIKKIEEEEEAGGGRFYEAIYRNTDLLLIRGVGYASSNSLGNNGSNINQLNEIGSDGNDNSALAVVQYLTNNLKLLNTNEIVILKHSHPTLFQLSLDNKIIPVIDYLRTLLLSTSSKSNSSSKTVQKVLKKIITQHPMLLQLDIETNLNYTVNYLRDTFDFTNEELTTVTSITPGILGLSVPNNLLPTINFMKDILQVYNNNKNHDDDDDDDDDDVNNNYYYENDIDDKEGNDESLTILLRRCVLKHPQILSLSLTNLLAKREYFDSIDTSMDINNSNHKARKNTTTKTSLAARILLTTPSVYSLSLQQNIIPKVNYLTTCLWGSNRTTISNNLYEYPQILTLSMQGNIIPTLSFYNMTGYIKLDTHVHPTRQIGHDLSIQQQQQSQQDHAKVSIRSRYIATSLYNRLLPRWHFLLEERERRKEQQQLKYQILSTLEESIISNPASYQNNITTAFHLLPSLHLLAGASDSNFCSQMKISLTEYLNYKEKEGSRLKFTSQFDTWLKTGRPIDLVD
jgi:hypothetical protein